MINLIKMQLNKHLLKYILLLVGLLLNFSNKAQVSITASHNALSMAQMLAGKGITISNAFYSTTCDSSIMAGKFAITGSSPFGLKDSGIVLTSGDVFGAVGPSATPSNSFFKSGDSDLAVLAAPQASNDGCALEFDLIPTGDTIKFKYVFASAEYQTFSCSIADVFGFFISGPGITGSFSGSANNIALLPNGCYVGVNTVNGQTFTPCGNATGICAPPNNALFVSNLPIGNTNTGIAYNGFTKPLFAVAAVQPCSTYHLKIAISDASDWILDSGVFLEAGSLSSNSISFVPSTLLTIPEPYVVEGCAAGGVIISRPLATPFPYIVNFLIGGTAQVGIDYATIPTTATILPNQTSVFVPINAFQDGIPEGKETIILYRQAQCDTSVIDSAVVYISDSLEFSIVTPDTTICLYDSVKIITITDSLYNITWSNIPFINNTTAFNPIVSPTITSTYFGTITLPNSGCLPVSRSITVAINVQPNVKIGPDITICKNMQYAFSPTITPVQNYTYKWTPNTFLNNPNIANPIGTFTAVGIYTYYLKVSPTAQGCAGYDTIVIRVLPNDITIVTPDTTVCDGTVFPIRINGDDNFSYQWSPTFYLNSAAIKSPICTPFSSLIYTVTASYPGCPNMNKSISVSTQPIPTFSLGADTTICPNDLLILSPNISPSNYPNYTYSWKPTTYLNTSNTASTIFSGISSNTLTFTVTTPIGCKGADTLDIDIYPSIVTMITNGDSLTRLYGDTITLNAINAQNYMWSPNFGLSTAILPNTLLTPIQNELYFVNTIDSNGCYGRDSIYITVTTKTPIVLPQIFTPNGDNNNDVFRIVHLGVNKVQEFKIYDRWGTEVFSGRNNDGWNGTFKGKDLEMETYKYYIKLANPNGTVEIMKGDFILLR